MQVIGYNGNNNDNDNSNSKATAMNNEKPDQFDVMMAIQALLSLLSLEIQGPQGAGADLEHVMIACEVLADCVQDNTLASLLHRFASSDELRGTDPAMCVLLLNTVVRDLNRSDYADLHYFYVRTLTVCEWLSQFINW